MSIDHQSNQPDQPTEPAQPKEPAKQKNTLGLIALIIAIIGTIFGCIPGAMMVGWILLPIAFILSLVSLFQKGKKHGTGITALIITVVGTIVSIIVSLAVVVTAVDDAINEDTTITDADENEDSSDDEDDDDAAEESSEEGGRGNPLDLGQSVESGDWKVTVNSVDFDASEAIQAENEFNEAADEGSQYIMANLTVEYTGDDEAGDMPELLVEYVTEEGNSFDSIDAMVVTPDELDEYSTLYPGASTTGNVAMEVPSEGVENGTLAVAPSLFGDSVFFAVQ